MNTIKKVNFKDENGGNKRGIIKYTPKEDIIRAIAQVPYKSANVFSYTALHMIPKESSAILQYDPKKEKTALILNPYEDFEYDDVNEIFEEKCIFHEEDLDILAYIGADDETIWGLEKIFYILIDENEYILISDIVNWLADKCKVKSQHPNKILNELLGSEPTASDLKEIIKG